MATFNAIDSALNWQQHLLKAGLVSTEMMRVGMNHMRRQAEYLNMITENLNSLGKLNTEFMQKMTAESASDWNRTAEIAAAWSREAPQNRTARQ
jgi:hypothetical protein